jgi:branched-chain amino acid transport system permease protein
MDLLLDPGGWYTAHLTVVQAILISTLLAASVQVCMRAGVFSLASVGFYAIGAYSSAILVKKHDVPYVVAILLAVLACALVGTLLALPLLRLRGLYMGLATVAFDLVVVVFAVNGGDFTGGPLGLYGIPVKVTVPQILVVLVVVGFVLTRLETGRPGRAMDALRNDEPLAAALGIRVARWRVFALTLSASIAGVAGAMASLLFNAISPEQFGFPLVITALSIVVVGGAGSWFGALIGAVIIHMLPLWLSSFAKWRELAYGVLLVVVIIYAPDGVLGLGRTAIRRIKGVRGRGPELAATPAGSAAGSVADGEHTSDVTPGDPAEAVR